VDDRVEFGGESCRPECDLSVVFVDVELTAL
jgi:hypothetical protein